MAASPSTRSTPLPPPSRVTCVYGDSTPFPHEGNFIETIRCSVECGVALLGAHQVIQRAVARAQEIDRARSLERARLHTMNDSVKRALAPEMATHAERMLRAGYSPAAFSPEAGISASPSRTLPRSAASSFFSARVRRAMTTPRRP